MPCFDPKNVLFITNKWDLLNKESKKSTNDSSDEEEESMTWKNILSEIKEQWPSVQEDHIFKMNLHDVSISFLFLSFGDAHLQIRSFSYCQHNGIHNQTANLKSQRPIYFVKIPLPIFFRQRISCKNV